MPILSEDQKKILSLIGGAKMITDTFYLSGGTALAEYYLGHRLSEDLDFFAEKEFDPNAISVFFKTMFTYFPFPRIEQNKKVGQLGIDSLLDIAVNKLFTIYQKPRSRDFIDLYYILQKEKSWSIDDLTEKAQIKFDHFLDPIQLSAQFVKAETLKDYPTMLISLPEKEWQGFFIQEAKRLAERQME